MAVLRLGALRLGFASLFLLTLPTGMHLVTGAVTFLLVLGAGMAAAERLA